MKYECLFNEGRIGNVTLKNRIVQPPLEVGMANFDGTPSEQIMNYYEERAKNGLGLLITGITRVNELHGATLPRQLAMSSDRHIKPFGEMVDRMHKHGTKVFCQLHHPGRQSLSLMIGSWPLMEYTGRVWPGFWKVFPSIVPPAEEFMDKVWAPAVVAPSAVPCKFSGQRTRALMHWEIRQLVNDFVEGARRVQLSGADGVELHAAHGYLIQQFLSTRTNKRTDEYGGSLENRMRFLMEIISGIRAVCGPDFPIVVRLAVDEYYRCIGETDDLGIELDEGVAMAQALERAGVDALDITSATYETMNYWLEPTSFTPGWRADLARTVRAAVNIPVIATNLIRSPEQAEQQLKDGVQDFVSLGRTLVADPEWITKVKEGREDEIRRCICCCYCFETLNANAAKGLPVQCALNPRLGREQETAVLPPCTDKRPVAVIGAGPAGLSTADTLARRGVPVVVFEQNAEVGGQLQLANKPPHKEKISWCFEYLATSARKHGAEIRLNTAADLETLKKLNPRAVIVATGGKAIHPPIPGADQKHVCTVTDILNGTIKPEGKRVAVIGSGLTGLETSVKLAEEGHNQVLIVEMADKIGPGAFHQHLSDVLLRLRPYNAGFRTRQKLVSITKKAIVLEDVQTGENTEHPADLVVLSVGVRPVNDLVETLSPHFDNVIPVGDASGIGRIAQAVHAGFDTAMNL